MRDLVRRVLTGAFVASAIVGSVTFVAVDGWEGTLARLCWTAMLVSLAGLVGFVCVAARPGSAWRAIGAAGLLATAVATGLGLVPLWGVGVGETYGKVCASFAILALTCAWASTLPTLHAPGTATALFGAALACLALTALMALGGTWMPRSETRWDRFTGAAFFATAGLTAALAAFRRLAPATPAGASPATIARHCPACGAALPVTSDGRSCPTCGALFTVTIDASPTVPR